MKPLIILILLAFLAGCASPAANTAESTAVSAGSSALENLAAAIPETSSNEPPVKASALHAAPAAITQDGQTRLHLIDLASGADVAGSSPLELPAGAVVSASAASPDRIHLALTSGVGRSCRSFGGGSSCYEAAETLHLVDVGAWQKLDVALPGKGYATPLAFNPDSSRLALAYNTPQASSLLVYDVASGEQTARLALDFLPEWMAYVLGGKTLAVYGSPLGDDPGVAQPPAPRLLLLDPDSLQEAKELRFDSLLDGDWCLENCDQSHELRRAAMWKPALALAPDGSRLYIVHADQETLTSIDLAQGAVHDAAIEQPTSWLERLLSATAGVAHAKGLAQGAIKSAVVSPDGSRLYVLSQRLSGDPQAEYEGQELQVIDLTSDQTPGSVLASTELTPDRYVYAMQPLSSGETLLLLGYVDEKLFIQAVSSGDLKPSTSLTGWQAADGPGVLLGQNLSEQDNELAVIDPVSLEVLRTWKVDGNGTWLPVVLEY
jgi:hypothetical protein